VTASLERTRAIVAHELDRMAGVFEVIGTALDVTRHTPRS
jgi:hypothetical protein